MTVTIYTTAPDVYDGPATRPCGHVGFTSEGQAIRAVEVELGASVAQARTYLAAGFAAMTVDELDDEIERGGHIDSNFSRLQSGLCSRR